MIRFVLQHVQPGATVYTDGSFVYDNLWREGFNHEAVLHRREYIRGEVSTNGIESFWAVVKRGYMGVYHKWDNKHLPRYIGEYVARHNMRPKDTIEQMQYIIECFEGKRRYCDLIA